MGVQVTRLKTLAETQLAAQFAALGEVSAERRAAFARFEAAGLPHKRVEAYHFTDVRAALRDALPPAIAPHNQDFTDFKQTAPGSFLQLDGFADAASFSAMPEGVSFSVNSLPGADADSVSDPLTDLNLAFCSQELLVDIAPGAVLAAPLNLFHLRPAAGASGAVYSRVRVRVGAGARISLMEGDFAAFATDMLNRLLVIEVGEGAIVSHFCVVQAGPAYGAGQSRMALHSNQITLAAKATFNSHAFLTGGCPLRRQIFLAFNGEHSTASLNGVTLLRGEEHADTTLTVTHAAPHCTSRETFRHIIDGEATGVFQGKIIVKPGAQKTDGKMMSKAVLLAETGIMNNKPELEIFADDVVCGHGATVGALGEDQLFYAMQRGIPRAQAEALLLEAFAGEVISTIFHDATREMMLDHLRNWLADRTNNP